MYRLSHCRCSQLDEMFLPKKRTRLCLHNLIGLYSERWINNGNFELLFMCLSLICKMRWSEYPPKWLTLHHTRKSTSLFQSLSLHTPFSNVLSLSVRNTMSQIWALVVWNTIDFEEIWGLLLSCKVILLQALLYLEVLDISWELSWSQNLSVKHWNQQNYVQALCQI